MSKHQISQEMVESLEIGERINVESGVGTTTLVALGPIQNADKSSYAGRTVLHTTGDEYFPFATHTLYFEDDGSMFPGRWLMTGGQSFQNLTDAVKTFERITGRVA